MDEDGRYGGMGVGIAWGTPVCKEVSCKIAAPLFMLMLVVIAVGVVVVANAAVVVVVEDRSSSSRSFSSLVPM